LSMKWRTQKWTLSLVLKYLQIILGFISCCGCNPTLAAFAKVAVKTTPKKMGRAQNNGRRT